MDRLWTCGGRSFGYRDGDDLWTHDGRHVGRFVGDEVFDRNGRYLGEMMGTSRLVTSQEKIGLVRDGFVPRASRPSPPRCTTTALTQWTTGSRTSRPQKQSAADGDLCLVADLLQFQWVVRALTRQRGQWVAAAADRTYKAKPSIVYFGLRYLQRHQHSATAAYPHVTSRARLYPL
uniref:4-fold beta flower protein n=1 Tax=Paraburkholderia caledonica TaxID=134536 RepID=UPI000B48E595